MQALVVTVPLILARRPSPASVTTQICMLFQVMAAPLHMMERKTASVELKNTVEVSCGTEESVAYVVMLRKRIAMARRMQELGRRAHTAT